MMGWDDLVLGSDEEELSMDIGGLNGGRTLSQISTELEGQAMRGESGNVV